jgi:hypothetical protein
MMIIIALIYFNPTKISFSPSYALMIIITIYGYNIQDHNHGHG